MASIRKRTWTTATGETRTAWTVDVVDASGNRQRRQFSTKREAERWRVQVEGQIQAGTYRPDAHNTTVGQMLDQWLDHCEKRVGVDLERWTLASYRGKVAHLRPPERGVWNAKLNAVTAGTVQDVYLHLIGAGLSHQNARCVISTLSAAFGWARGRNMIAVNPVDGFRRSDSRNTEKVTAPDHETVKRLIRIASDNGDWFGLYLLFAATTGLRASEQRGLRWCDLDLKAGSVTVGSRIDRYGQRGAPKSSAGHRTVPLPPQLVQQLRAHKLKNGGKDDAPVFPARGGGFLRHENVAKSRWDPVRQRAGVPHMHWHALRHYAISCWVAAGVPIKVVQQRAGHSSIRMTLDRYSHVMPGQADGTEMEGIASRILDGT